GADSAARGRGALADVEVLARQTGLSRAEVGQLVGLDLAPRELDAGRSRGSFVNQSGEPIGPLAIESSVEDVLFAIASGDGLALDRREMPGALTAGFRGRGGQPSAPVPVLVAEPAQAWRAGDAQADGAG